MRIWILAAVLASFGAHAAPASEASVDALLAVTRTESLMDSMYTGVDQVMRQAMAESLKGKTLTAQQQRMLDALPGKFVTVMREEMSWQRMKPLYVQLYRETFEQDEVDGMLAFYASPAGQAVLNKMPVVMQKSMALSQSLMQSLFPRMNQALEEAMREAKVPPGQ